MSKFAAIEARATQYPASTNDVVWLVSRVRELRKVLELAKQDMAMVVNEQGGPFARRLQQRIYDAEAALAGLHEPNLPVETL